jgi:hypothetical protein
MDKAVYGAVNALGTEEMIPVGESGNSAQTFILRALAANFRFETIRRAMAGGQTSQRSRR